MAINNLVETHCHITPGVDDGSSDIKTSMSMLKSLHQQGAQTVILTPHYYSDVISLNDFADKRDKAIYELQEAIDKSDEELPTIIPGAEIFISRYLLNNTDLTRVKVQNTDYALIEHPFSASFGSHDCDRMVNLMYDFNVRPILAHIERYKALMADEKLVDKYIDMGCLVQVNVSSFVDSGHSVRKRLIKYLNADRIHLLGSDCHNMTSRPPEWQKGIDYIVKKCGQAKVDELMANAKEVSGI